jgi:hypothetical protein
MTEPARTPPDPRKRRRIIVGAILGLVVAVATAASLSRPTVLGPRLPDPNGYDDLVRAGSMIQGTWPSKGDLARADVAEVKAFVEANKPALDRARVGLDRECLMPLENSLAGLEKRLDALGRTRSLSRLFQGEAIVAQAEGRVSDAARIDRDSIALGQAMTQGGMGNDVAVGWMVQSLAIVRLRRLKDRLPAETCRSLIRELESLEGRRVTLGAVRDRWADWYRGSYNLYQRSMMRWSGIEKSGEQSELAVAKKSRDKVERDMRFFMVELAIHAYHEDKGTWPRTVRELVPDYLRSALIDPATGKTLEYPANPSGELTDDLGSIARPDGEVNPRP